MRARSASWNFCVQAWKRDILLRILFKIINRMCRLNQIMKARYASWNKTGYIECHSILLNNVQQAMREWSASESCIKLRERFFSSILPLIFFSFPSLFSFSSPFPPFFFPFFFFYPISFFVVASLKNWYGNTVPTVVAPTPMLQRFWFSLNFLFSFAFFFFFLLLAPLSDV